MDSIYCALRVMQLKGKFILKFSCIEIRYKWKTHDDDDDDVRFANFLIFNLITIARCANNFIIIFVAFNTLFSR